jgi:hypothetical protein
MLIEKNTISKIFLVANAFVISQDTLLNHNQIKGRRMTAEFSNQALKHVKVDGNGESLYFALDEKTNTLTGMNKIICSNMVIRFVDKKVNNISFYVRPEANFIPPHELNAEQKKLEGFEWMESLRPTRKDVVKTGATVSAPIERRKSIDGLTPKTDQPIKNLEKKPGKSGKQLRKRSDG